MSACICCILQMFALFKSSFWGKTSIQGQFLPRKFHYSQRQLLRRYFQCSKAVFMAVLVNIVQRLFYICKAFCMEKTFIIWRQFLRRNFYHSKAILMAKITGFRGKTCGENFHHLNAILMGWTFEGNSYGKTNIIQRQFLQVKLTTDEGNSNGETYIVQNPS